MKRLVMLPNLFILWELPSLPAGILKEASANHDGDGNERKTKQKV